MTPTLLCNIRTITVYGHLFTAFTDKDTQIPVGNALLLFLFIEYEGQ